MDEEEGEGSTVDVDQLMSMSMHMGGRREEEDELGVRWVRWHAIVMQWRITLGLVNS